MLLRRLPFAAMALTHAVFPGAVVAHLLGLPLAAGAWVVAPVMAVGLGRLAAAGSLDPSTAAGVALSASSAWAVMLMAAAPVSSVELSSLLVGSVLTVSDADVVATAVGGTIVVAVVLALHKELVHGAFDPVGQAALGYPVGALDVLVLLLVAVVSVAAVPAVGSLLAVAILVAPAASARVWGTGVAATSAVGAAVGAASGVGGLAASHRWDVAAGGAVALIAGAFFGASAVAAAAVRRRRVNEAMTTRRGCGRAPAAG